jgi:hypothetical protein
VGPFARACPAGGKEHAQLPQPVPLGLRRGSVNSFRENAWAAPRIRPNVDGCADFACFSPCFARALRTDLTPEDARQAIADLELLRAALLAAGWHSSLAGQGRTLVVELASGAELRGGVNADRIVFLQRYPVLDYSTLMQTGWAAAVERAHLAAQDRSRRGARAARRSAAALARI